MAADDTHYVYMIECNDGSLYTGYTTDIERRLHEHNMGEGAKYTAGRAPVELVYSESYVSRPAAMRREYQLKQLSRGQKEALIGGL